MQNSDQIFTLLAVNEGFGLNLDILETGLLNIIALVAILIFAGRPFVGSLLEERKAEIENGIQDAEKRLNDATRRLDETRKQLNQANILIDEIKTETKTTKKVLLKTEVSETKKNLAARFNKAIVNFRSKERQVFVEVKQQIILLLLKRTLIRAKETFSIKQRAKTLINETINKLEGDLL
tara:strand:+ start:1027 stop:1566 length:540 start_codon:yes stop_codon:yes gene_type:complete